MVAFTYALGAGFPGATNRNHDATVTAEAINSANAPAAYGIGICVDANGIRPPTGTDTSINGLYVRPYPTQGGGPVSGIVNDPLGTSTPPNAGIGNVLKRGFMTVRLAGGGPVVKGGQVFISTVAATAGQVFGTSAAAGASPITLGAQTYFNGPADPGGITEIAFNL